MPPKKHRVRPGDVDHQGRVTVPRDTVPLPHPTRSPPSAARGRPRSETSAPAASSRYTPPNKSVRFRPGWHTAVGAGLLALGGVVAVLNEVMLLQDVTLLPGGHSEAYLVLAVVIAGYGTWWFGWFDREG